MNLKYIDFISVEYGECGLTDRINTEINLVHAFLVEHLFRRRILSALFAHAQPVFRQNTLHRSLE